MLRSISARARKQAVKSIGNGRRFPSRAPPPCALVTRAAVVLTGDGRNFPYSSKRSRRARQMLPSVRPEHLSVAQLFPASVVGSDGSARRPDIISSLAGNLVIFKTVLSGITDYSMGFEIILLEEACVEGGSRSSDMIFFFLSLIHINESDVNSEAEHKISAPEAPAGCLATQQDLLFSHLCWRGASKPKAESQTVPAGPSKP